MLRTKWWASNTNDCRTHDILDQEKLERVIPKRTQKRTNNLNQQLNWNKPVNDDGANANSSSPEPQGSERSPSSVPASVPEPRIERDPAPSERSRSSVPVSMPEPRVEPSFEVPVTGSRRTEVEAPLSNREPASRFSHPEEESYTLPAQSSSTAPRMIQQSSSGRPASQNAFKRLKSMGSSIDHPEKLPALPPPGDLGQYGYPTTKSAEKKPQTAYPGYKTYQVTRCNCCLTTFIMIVLAVCAIGTLIFAVMNTEKDCQSITVMIILVSLILLLIIGLEWTRKWIWREPSDKAYRKKASLAVEASMGPPQHGTGLPIIGTTPGQLPNPTYTTQYADSNPTGGFLSYLGQQRMYDIPQFLSALCLLVLYVIGGLLICGLMATASVKLEKCQTLGLSGIAYAAVLAILLCTRTVMCCISEACRGFCHRTAKKNGPPPVPIVSENQLHQFLPGMGGYWHTGGETTAGSGLPTTWLVNLTNPSDPRQQLSMIKPMPPQYGNELSQ